MKKHNLVSNMSTTFCLSLGSILLTEGCGKQTNTTQSDDVESSSTISYSGGWGGSAVKIQISSQIISENQANPANQDVTQQLQNAVNTWNQAIGRVVLVLDTNPSNYIAEDGNSIPSCDVASRLYFPLCNGSLKGLYYDRVSTSDVTKAKSSWTSGWEYNTGKNTSILATTVWNASGNTMTSADIRFNRDSYIFGNSALDEISMEDGVQKTLVDLESVALHELGHVLGLGHDSKLEESIMYPTMNIGPDRSNPNYSSGVNSLKRILAECDIKRVKHIYNGEYLDSKYKY